MKKALAGAFALTALVLTGCKDEPQPRTEILAYVGITMAKPMAEIARLMEERHPVDIVITQGGSEDLYTSLSQAKLGDLYLPGSASYRKRHLADGYLMDFVALGYNQSALFVAKGNPKQVKPDLRQLLRDELHVVVCNPESGSIGNETRRILERKGLYEAVYDRAEYLTTDSRNLNKALREGDADVTVNWRATAFFAENRDVIDVVDLPPDLVNPKLLQLSLLSFSQNPDWARKFMALAASAEGQAIFRKYGFIDAAGKRDPS